MKGIILTMCKSIYRISSSPEIHPSHENLESLNQYSKKSMPKPYFPHLPYPKRGAPPQQCLGVIIKGWAWQKRLHLTSVVCPLEDWHLQGQTKTGKPWGNHGMYHSTMACVQITMLNTAYRRRARPQVGHLGKWRKSRHAQCCMLIALFVDLNLITGNVEQCGKGALRYDMVRTWNREPHVLITTPYFTPTQIK